MILGVFQDDMGDQVKRLREAVLDHSPEAARLAHALKGSSGNVSAEELSGLAGRVEHHVRRDDWDDAVIELHYLEKAHLRVRHYLDAWLRTG